MLDRLEELERKFEGIEQQLLDPDLASKPAELQRLGKARAELANLVEVIRNYKRVLRELDDASALLSDPDMREMAEAEIASLRQEKDQNEQEIKVLLLPKDPNDDKNVIIEIRPAAGGDEAGLFAAELFRMYMRYAERRGWKVELMEHDETGIGGVSKVSFKIAAQGAYSHFKFESGVHRVQRVPATESGGRIHTSTVTVAVMPEAEEVDVAIKADDIEISTFRSSSAGGQHMQKNETAVRIVHKPSGIVVTCQDERSQQQNKERAMSVLRTKLYEAELERQAQERGDLVRGQVGSGDRSEKIRTYNFPQDRISDHRIGMTIHGLPIFMDGDIQKLLDALVQDDQARRMAEQEGI